MATATYCGEAETTKRVLPWLVAVAFFKQQLDTTILNTAVPVIASAKRVTPLATKSVLASYMLSLAVFIPVSGWMADRFGTRRVFVSAIGLFTLGSALCGLSTNITMLVACRIVQGAGGAMLIPVGRMTMVRAFPKSELISAMSFVAVPSLVGPMLGPILGGLIVVYLHWSVIFFVNVPVGVLGLYLVWRHLPDYREPATPPVDILGLLFFGSGIALLSYLLEIFGAHTLRAWQMLELLVLAIALLVAYGFRAIHTAFPLLKLDLFRIRTFRVAVSGSFFTRLGLGGTPFLFPLLYQIGFGLSPIASGLLVMPQALAAMGLKMLVPAILSRVGYRRVLLVNTVLAGVFMMSFATVGIETPLWRIVVQAFLLGLFTSMQYTSMNTLVYADISTEQTSAASTIASTGQQMSMSFGVAIASLLAAIFVPVETHAMPAAMMYGVQKAFLLLGGITMLSSVVFLKLERNDGKSITCPEHRVADIEA